MEEHTRQRLSLSKETIRALQDSELSAVNGGGTGTIDTQVNALCGGVDLPPWVSTSPPTHMCQ